MNDGTIVARGADGFYHPKNEGEIIALVRYAVANQRLIRVRGASHSTAWSIFTDPVDGVPRNQTLVRTPPTGPNLDLSLDQMIALEWCDEANGIVEAEAGIHLGPDPYDAIAEAALANSLLFQTFQKGWGINDLGGITHQTISGFTATGSAGGSLMYELDNVIAFRVVDGTGEASWIERSDPIFDAMRVSVGLLGIVTKVRLQLNPAFNIYGQEATSAIEGGGCPIDLFGPGDADRPSMRRFLEQAPYSRVLWWPQRKAERIVVWQATRQDVRRPEVFEPVPYQEFTPDLGGWVRQLIASIFYLLLGNRGFAQTVPKIWASYARFVTCVAAMWAPPTVRGPAAGNTPATVAATLIAVVLAIVLFIPSVAFILVPSLLVALFPTALNIFQPLTEPGKPTLFQDYYWRSLCMDNTADDILLGTEFTEIWVPLQHTERCMRLLNEMFATRGPAAIGTFSTEIYASPPSTAWISPGYSDGSDEYKDGTVRFDVFWFRGNAGDPNVEGGFFQQYWDAFTAAELPFRFHWGKFIPAYDFDRWAMHYRTALPKFDDFLQLREARDPHGVFFTRYWRERFLGSAR